MRKKLVAREKKEMKMDRQTDQNNNEREKKQSNPKSSH